MTGSWWIMGSVLPDIPRAYTALAEWLACLIAIIELKPRLHGVKRWALAVGVLIFQAVYLVLTDDIDGPLWIICMMGAVIVMFLFLYFSCEGNVLDAGYRCVESFMLAEFVASLEWQIESFFRHNMGIDTLLSRFVFLLVIYGSIYLLAGYLTRRYLISKTGDPIPVHKNELVMAVIIGASVFALSNVSFIFSNTPFSGHIYSDIFAIRTVIDLGGLAILYAYHIQRKNLLMNAEMDLMQQTLQNQYIQYEQSKETIDLINYKYHDLKHHILVLRGEENKEKRDQYLDQMEEEIKAYEAQNKTGNSVLDILLTSKSILCMKENISLTSVVDGGLLGFMDDIDICSIFGNALDNAIECERRIEDVQKRLIHMSVYNVKAFLMITVENYCEDEVELGSELPKTTKEDSMLHGYGLKSLRHTVHKYEGEVDLALEDNWFKLKILIPLPRK